MTDASESTASPPPAAPETVLAHGHLHPAILLLRLLDALKQAGLPVIVGIALQNVWFIAFGCVTFVLQLGYAVARYLTLEFTLTSEELRVREGLLQRQERRIPLDRIQDLGLESSLLRRALGLCVVMVETASGRGVEARLDALSWPAAEHLRQVLLDARTHATAAAAVASDPGSPQPSAEPGPPAPPSPEWLVHRATTGELLLRGVTDLRLSAVVVTGFAALQLADQLGFAARVSGLADGARNWLLQFSPLVTAALLIAVLMLVIGAGVVSATLGNLVQFHGFALTLRDSVLQRRYGLLTTRQKTLPRARIQRVTIEQPWLRRLFGVASVKADSAGGSRSEGEDSAGGFDVVVPLTRLDRANALLPALLPGIENEPPVWQSGSGRLVLRTTLQGAVLAAIAAAGLSTQATIPTGLALLLVPVWALLGVLIWRNLAYAAGGDFLFLQHGLIGRTAAFLPMPKVQTVVVRQSPFAQLLGLADLTVYVAGGSPTCLPHLLAADARALANTIAQQAAVAAARDW